MENNIDYYIMVQNIIPKDVCDLTVKQIKDKKWKLHGWYNNFGDKSYSEKRESVETLDHSFEWEYMNATSGIMKWINKALGNYIEKLAPHIERKGLPMVKSFSLIKFNRYKKDASLRYHIDHIHSIFDGREKGVPILSIVLNLNDDYTGCEFMCRNKEIKLKKGDILIFPSNFMFPHEVKKCKTGIRYSAITWAY